MTRLRTDSFFNNFESGHLTAHVDKERGEQRANDDFTTLCLLLIPSVRMKSFSHVLCHYWVTIKYEEIGIRYIQEYLNEH